MTPRDGSIRAVAAPRRRATTVPPRSTRERRRRRPCRAAQAVCRQSREFRLFPCAVLWRGAQSNGGSEARSLEGARMGFAAKASRAPRPTAARARRRIARPVRASSSSPLHPGAGEWSVGDLPSCVGWVRRIDRRGVAREFYVVGTVHTPGSASADEVRSVIERVKPNAVVLELTERLTACSPRSCATRTRTR